MHADWIVFWVIAPISVLSGIAMVLARSAVHAALLLIVNFFTLAVFFLVLGSPFLFVVQIIVYAGAIMVLFLFVVMLLNAPREETEYDERVHPLLRPWPMRLGAALAVALVVELWWALTKGAETGEFGGAAVDSVPAIGQMLFTQYAFGFEVTSVLILVAMVGAVVLARREPR